MADLSGLEIKIKISDIDEVWEVARSLGEWMRSVSHRSDLTQEEKNLFNAGLRLENMDNG